MGYELRPNNNSNMRYDLDIANCEITGNTVKYTLSDGSIMQYSLDAEGDVKKGSGKDSDNIELTKYQISVFEALKGCDGNNQDFTKKDLKNLTEDDVVKLINDQLNETSDCEAKEATITKKSLKVMFWDYERQVKRYLTIEFKSKFSNNFANFFRNLFSSNKVERADRKSTRQTHNVDTNIVVGNLEEQPIDITKMEDNAEAVEPTLSNREIRKAERKARWEARRRSTEGRSKDFNFKGSIEPEYEYSIKKGETALKIANDLGIPLSCIKAANPNVNWNSLQIGQKIIIPERRSVENIEIKSLDEVAEYTGLSKFYIEELLCNIEKNHPTVYDDAKQNGKKNGNYAGTLTIGYGHTGSLLGKYFKKGTEYAQQPNERFELKRAMEDNHSIIELSNEDAYQILAQDLLNMRAEAEAYFGEAFNEAPQSIQDAIIDVIFNKGVDTGLEGYYTVYKNKEKITKRKETPTRNLYENIVNKDYVSAAQNVCYSSNLKGLNKRNIYRVIVATQELSSKERLQVLGNLEPYCMEVAETLSTGVKVQLLEAWEKAKNGVFDNFTL